MENPVNVPKTASHKITTLQIEESRHLGSLTCHVLRDTSKPVFDKFNATTNGLAFTDANTYDPYDFGKKRTRFYNCDIFLIDANFPDLAVDLEVVLILQPLIRRSRGQTVCDVPLITRKTVRIEFEGFDPSGDLAASEVNEVTLRPSRPTQNVLFTTIIRRTSFKIEKGQPTSSLSTTSTKRQPKVVPQFATTRPSRPTEAVYVDGFNVGNNGLSNGGQPKPKPPTSTTK